jgi:RNA polymerase sigma factor (sigma-70 family)
MSLLSGDRTLLEAFRRGERVALARVYDEYAPGIAAFLTRGFTFASKGRPLQFRGFHQPFDLENAVQETFVRAFSDRARQAYDGINPYRSYVTVIARNFVLSELRSREVAASQLVMPRDDPEELSSGEEELLHLPLAHLELQLSAEATLLQRELAQLVRGFLDELNDVERALFSARFEEELSQVAAGVRAGLSQMQVRTLEKKLRRRFLRHMQQSGYLETYGSGPTKRKP